MIFFFNVKFATFLVINILIQFLLCGWSLAMREHLPSSVEIYIDDSFVEFLDKFSRTKVDNLHLWNRMQSQVTLIKKVVVYTYTPHTYTHTRIFVHICKQIVLTWFGCRSKFFLFVTTEIQLIQIQFRWNIKLQLT